MRLRSADVDRYGPIHDWHPPFDAGVTVLSGPNEAGKTLYLEALLQLLEPELADRMDPPPRVDAPPRGRIVMEIDDETVELSGERRLGELTAIDPVDLETVFVVRDEDLALPTGGSYYRSLIERLGAVHTSAISAVREELRQLGRLTESRLDLSDQIDDAKSTRSAAAALRADVHSYLEGPVESEGLDDLHATRLRVERERRSTASALAAQRDAKVVAEHESLSDHLETVEATTESLRELPDVGRSTLDMARERNRELSAVRETRADRADALDSVRDDLAAAEETLEEVQATESRLDRRVDALDTARDALDAFRSTRDRATRATRVAPLGRRVAIAGLAGAGITGGLGAVAGSTAAIVLGGGLFVAGVTGAGLAVRARRASSRVERARRRAIEAARDADLSVDAVDDIAPAIEEVRAERASTRDRRVRTESRVESLSQELDDLASTCDELDDRIDRLAAELDETLSTAGVSAVDALESVVEQREALERERELAEQALSERLDDPGATDVDARIEFWADALASLVEGVDRAAVSDVSYDPDRLEALEAELDHLEERREALDERLAAYDRRVERFRDRAADLGAGPFDVDPIRLEGRSVTALRALIADLEGLIEAIDHDADKSRRAIELVDEVATEEERKLTDLFDADGPASTAFAQITGERYRSVGFDPEGYRLTVTRDDGRTFEADHLSSGTRDQLYFASRVALARHLLGEGAGFFLLDDPFVAADHERLERGFEGLLDLADAGWQIVYLTAKREVHTEMVDRFDVEQATLPSIT